jgi:hypothetical protein
MERQQVEHALSRPIFKRHEDTEALIRTLWGKPIGTTILYSELKGICGRNMLTDKSIFYTAQAALAADQQFWQVVPAVGVKRVEPHVWLDSQGTKTRKHIGRISHKKQRYLSYLVREDLAPEARSRLALEQTLLALHEGIERRKSVESFRVVTNAEEARLGLKESLRLLGEINLG